MRGKRGEQAGEREEGRGGDQGRDRTTPRILFPRSYAATMATRAVGSHLIEGRGRSVAGQWQVSGRSVAGQWQVSGRPRKAIEGQWNGPRQAMEGHGRAVGSHSSALLRRTTTCADEATS